MHRVAIAAGSELSAAAGANVADAGGSAVDAALAAALVAAVTEPGVCALGGGGFIAVLPPTGDPVLFDGFDEMPGRKAAPEQFGAGGRPVHLEYGAGVDTIVGYPSVATPGTVAAVGDAWQRYGTVPWRVIVEPSADTVRRGFALSSAAHHYLEYAHEVIFGWHPESHPVLHDDDGRLLPEGSVIHLPELADALAHIAEAGADTFYRGDLARVVSDDMERNGALLGAADLADYRAIARSPIQVPFGGWEIATNPPPAVGGSVLAAMLLLAEREHITEWNAETVAAVAELQYSVLEFRRRNLAPSPDLAAQIAELLRAARLGELQQLLSAPSTIHTSAVDTDGWACAVTISSGYGSGVMVPGTGIWFNNTLGELELNPAGFHRYQPGTRISSNMAPAVGRRPDGAVLAIGSPGADRITTAMLCTLISHATVGMTLDDAVHAARLHVDFSVATPRVMLEPGLAADRIERPVHRFDELSMYFGGVQVAAHEPEEGLVGSADRRRTGAVVTAGRR